MTEIPANFVYNSCLAENDTFKGRATIVVRLKQNENNFKLEVIKQKKESIVFKDEETNYLIEYAENKLVITGNPSHVYVVVNWCAVSVVNDPHPANYKYFVQPLPGFDENSFPFLAFCGE